MILDTLAMAAKPLAIRQPRRAVLKGLGVAGLAAIASRSGAAITASRKPITVLTNHNDDTLSLFEDAFERAQPAYRLKFIWMMPPDAMAFVRRGGASADVWWQAAPHNHLADLAREDYMQPLGLDTAGLPDSLGGALLAGEGDYCRATQVTAFAFMTNRAAIAAQGLPAPTDWDVLCRPAYIDRLAMPDPSKLRFGTMLIEMVLQSYGWAEGWARLSALAGNARILPDRIGHEVSSGALPVGLAVDIEPSAEQRIRQPVSWTYPAHGGILATGYVGLFKAAAEAEGGRTFARYLLSAPGQSLQFRTDLPRLPIRPDVYAAQGPDQFNPFAAEREGQFTCRFGAGGARGPVVSALFGALTADQADLKALWQRLHAAEARGGSPKPAQARAALEAVPLSDKDANSDSVRQAFRRRPGGGGAGAVPPSRRSGDSAAPLPAGQAPGGEPSTINPANFARAFSNGEAPGTVNGPPEAAVPLIAAWQQAARQQRQTADRLLREAGA